MKDLKGPKHWDTPRMKLRRFQILPVVPFPTPPGWRFLIPQPQHMSYQHGTIPSHTFLRSSLGYVLSMYCNGWISKYVCKHNLTSVADPLYAIENLGTEILLRRLGLLWPAHGSGRTWCLGVQPQPATCLATCVPPILICSTLTSRCTRSPRRSWQHDSTSTAQFRKFCHGGKLVGIDHWHDAWWLKPLANVSQVLGRLLTGSRTDSLAAVCGPPSSLKSVKSKIKPLTASKSGTHSSQATAFGSPCPSSRIGIQVFCDHCHLQKQARVYACMLEKMRERERAPTHIRRDHTIQKHLAWVKTFWNILHSSKFEVWDKAHFVTPTACHQGILRHP